MTQKDYGITLSAKDETRKAFESLNNNLKKSEKNLGNLAKKSSNSMGALGRNAGQASIQVQQFVGQVQIGVNPMTALSQQAADLGFVLGAPLIGSIVALAAGFGAFLIPSLFKGKNATRDLIEEITKLSETQLLSSDQADFLASQENLTIKERQKSIKQLEKQIKLNEKNLELMSSEGTGLDKGEFAVPRSQDQNRKRYLKAIRETNVELLEQKANLSLLEKQIEDSRKKIVDYVKTSKGLNLQTEKEKETVQSLIQSISEQNELLGKSALEVDLHRARKAKATDEQLEAIRADYAEIEAKRELMEVEKQAELQAKRLARETEREVAAQARNLETIRTNLTAQIIALEQGEEAALSYRYAQQLGLDKVPDDIQKQIDKIHELKSVQEEAGTFWENLSEHISSTSQDFETMWGQTFDRFAQGIGDATAGAILEGQNFSDTMRTFARSAIQEVISGLIQIGIKRTVLSGIESALTVKSTAETIAATSAIATSTAATMAPAAAATSLATAGTNSAPAISGMGLALAAAAGMFALSSFEGGGYTGDGARIGGVDGKGGRLAVIHPREFVTDLTKNSMGGSINISAPITIQGSADQDTIRSLERNQKRFARMVQAVVSKPI